MAKIVIPDIGSGFNLNKINDAFQQLENELNDKVLYRDNPVGEQNFLQNDIDMNQNDILNAGLVQARTFAFADGQSIEDIINDAKFWAEQAQASSEVSAQSADDSRIAAEDAQASAFEADQSEQLADQHRISADNSRVLAESAASDATLQAQAAEQYSLLGLSANTEFFDMGLVSDTVIIFPTDLGSLV